MVYQMKRELPQDAKEQLPEETIALYHIAYQSALQWYGEETKAHRIAWSAVRSQAASLNSVVA